MSDILTKQQVASLLECEPETVEEKARAGVLPGIKFGRSWVFPREALLTALNKMAVAGRPSVKAPAIHKGVQRRQPPQLADLT